MISSMVGQATFDPTISFFNQALVSSVIYFSSSIITNTSDRITAMNRIGLQIGVELTNLKPVRRFLDEATTRVVEFATELKKSGSDIVVEVNLAEAFGGVRITHAVEEKFRSLLKHGNIKHISSDGTQPFVQMVLKSGPGPTVLHAVAEANNSNQSFLNAVIQLSLLGATQHRMELARNISDALDKRFAEMPEAQSSPGFEGILNSLISITAQTTKFPWQDLMIEVEKQLNEHIPDFEFAPAYTSITAEILLGAIDAFRIVQSLPRTRRIVVTNQTGCIVLITWAYAVLGLHVRIVSPQFPSIDFCCGSDHFPQVIIQWASQDVRRGLRLPRLRDRYLEVSNPEFRLEDLEKNILLKVFPDDMQRGRSLQTVVRHSIKGWGTTYLFRLLKNSLPVTSTKNIDVVYSEIVKYATSMAFLATRNLCRGSLEDNPLRFEMDNLTFSVEQDRVVEASKLLFHGIGVDERDIYSTAAMIREQGFSSRDSPHAFTRLDDNRPNGHGDAPSSVLIEQTKALARFLLPLACIAELRECERMPLLMDDDFKYYRWQQNSIDKCTDCRKPGELLSEEAVFKCLCSMVTDDGDTFTAETDSSKTFLFCNAGWSIFFDVVGEKDPSKVRPELLHVVEGVPTNDKTKEQKCILRDGSGVNSPPPDCLPQIRRSCLEERQVAKLVRRQEAWVSFTDALELVTYVTLQYTDQAIANMDPLGDMGLSEAEKTSKLQDLSTPFDIPLSYRTLHKMLWSCHVTPRCKHSGGPRDDASTTRLGIDAIISFCLSPCLPMENAEQEEDVPEKMRIFLTRDAPTLRWMIVNSYLDERLSERNLMLRDTACCDECALNHTASFPGKWFLVL